MTTSNYLTKALVLYDSLVEVCANDFTLYYFTFDDSTYDYLIKLDYKNIIPISLNDLENFSPQLLNVKVTRTTWEYFFTCSPQIIDFALKRYNLDSVIYLDADLYFYKNPSFVLNEMNNHSVLITEHRYYPKIEKMPQGKYCVQFIPFYNNKEGNIILNDWKEKCIEWCYMREEDGKWADQGYLNDWPERFNSVKVMKNEGAGLASWNAGGYDFEYDNENLTIKSKETGRKFDVVFYHFHGLKMFTNGLIHTGISKSFNVAYDLVYKNYVEKLAKKESEILKKLKIPRRLLNYDIWKESWLIFYLKIIRRIIIPKKDDSIYLKKFNSRYLWLP